MFLMNSFLSFKVLIIEDINIVSMLICIHMIFIF